MEFQSKLAGFARRAAAELPGSTFDAIIRSVGEAKSNADETELVKRMISIVKEGLTQNSLTPKIERDILLYLVYIDMLGHDTSWAHASVIRMCSSKNLLVKKVAYLTASLLIDPSSELTIMVTATIQSDLKSDNFLIVCAAQHAVTRFANPELISVFLPQMIGLLKHDKDVVKKKSLMVLHRFLQLDDSLAQDLERHFVEKLGYKEPSVMVAALCGLQELIKRDPKAYLNLVHYFTSILKQAAEGKLGHSYDYHRAPAPFVQIHLLRLLSLLGAADASCSNNMGPVIAEVWRRGEALVNNIGNALVYECLRTVATIQSNGAYDKQKQASITRLLSSHDNNLKYAAIDVLSRLVNDDIGAAQQHQYAVVECLRSADSTLKLKTLNLLYAMAGTGNIEVVSREALDYLDQADDDVVKKEAAMRLVDLAERFAPDQDWFVDTLSRVFEVVGDVLPPSMADHLIAVFSEGGSGSVDLPRKYVSTYMDLLDRPKLPVVVLKVICWVVGEYGGVAQGGMHAAMDKLASIPETQSPSEEVSCYLLTALGKLGVKAAGQLTPDAERYLDATTKSETALLQQQAVEIKQLLRASLEVQATAFPRTRAPEAQRANVDLGFLDAYADQALAAGAAPYIGLHDRVAMGMSSAPAALMPRQLKQSPLRYSAYAETQAPRPAAPIEAVGFAAPSASPGGASPGGAAPGAAAAAVASGSNEPKLMLGKKERKWGPSAAPPAAPSPSGASSESTMARPGDGYAGGIDDFRTSNWQTPPSASKDKAPAPPPRDPEKERLAASLFGGPMSSSSGRSGQATRQQQTAQVPDLLGGLLDSPPPATASNAVPASVMDLLGELDVSHSSSTAAPVAQHDIFGLYDLSGPVQAGGMGQFGGSQPPPNGNASSSAPTGKTNADPFASLLD